jgi:hypothetical protein
MGHTDLVLGTAPVTRNVREAAVAEGTALCLVARTHVTLLPLTIIGLDSEFDLRPEPGGAPVLGDGSSRKGGHA